MTVMTNLGFFHFAKANQIATKATKVGDRYVLEEMLSGGYNIGGEQSGHIIFLTKPLPATANCPASSCWKFSRSPARR